MLSCLKKNVTIFDYNILTIKFYSYFFTHNPALISLSWGMANLGARIWEAVCFVLTKSLCHTWNFEKNMDIGCNEMLLKFEFYKNNFQYVDLLFLNICNYCFLLNLKCVHQLLLEIIDTIQDFLIKLGIKPRMHLLEIGIFSLYHVIVRPTKIMNRAYKNWAHF